MHKINSKMHEIDSGIQFDFPTGEKGIFFFGNFQITEEFINELVLARQNHTGTNIIYPDEYSRFEFFDGLVSYRSVKQSLGVKTADCLPVLFASEKIKGCFHSGWRGLTNGIVENLYEKVKIMGEDFSKITFVIGPHICGRCYEVKEDVADIFIRFAKERGISHRVFMSFIDHKIFIDLASCCKAILKSFSAKNIFEVKICVKEDKRFFSRRRGDSSSQISAIF